MTDILDALKTYPDDPSAVLTKRIVGAVIAEIERLRAELAAAREGVKEAYEEGYWDAADHDTHTKYTAEKTWLTSKAKARIDAALNKATN